MTARALGLRPRGSDDQCQRARVLDDFHKADSVRVSEEVLGLHRRSLAACTNSTKYAGEPLLLAPLTKLYLYHVILLPAQLHEIYSYHVILLPAAQQLRMLTTF